MHSPFHTLYFEATRKCNFNCEFCSSGSDNSRPIEPDIPFDIIKNRILIPAYEIGTRFIDFSGGEFLLRKDAFDILELANEMGFRIGIASNGSTLNDSTIKRLKKILGSNLLISLGINSFDELNINTRDISSDKTVSLITRLEQEQIKMNICITMAEYNKDTFLDSVSRIRNHYLPFNRIPFVPRNKAAHELMVTKETMKNCFHPALRKYFHGYVSYVPFFLDPKEYAKVSGQHVENGMIPLNPSIGCWCGSFYSITPAGEIAPCPLLGDHLSGGNILKQDLKEILFESELFSKIVDRSKFKGKCGNCKYTSTCGGCRAMAYYKTGDVFAEDPTCFIDDLSEDELNEMEQETKKNFRNYLRMAQLGGLYSAPDQKSS